MVVSVAFDNYLCIFTNLLAIIPAFLFFIDKNYYDGIYTLTTGTVSFLYHINNNSPNILSKNILDESTIATIDTIYSETLIMNVATYILLYKNHNIRAGISAFFLPIFVYIDFMKINLNAHIRYSFIALLGTLVAIKYIYGVFCSKTIKLYKFIILCFGAFLNILELVAYEELQNKYTYNFFHSIHHICAFLSITLYFFVPLNFTSAYYKYKNKYCLRCKNNCKKKIKVSTPIRGPIRPNASASNLQLIEKRVAL